MTTLLFANNIKTTLSAPITTTSTTITVSSGAGMPVPTTGQTFLITLVDASTGLLYEIASCTTRSGNTLIVARGQEGTTPLNWNAGDTVAMFPTAGTMQNFAQISGAAFTGAVSATTLTASGLLTANTAYLPGGSLQIGANSPNVNVIFKNDATISTNNGVNYYALAKSDGGTYTLNINGNASTAYSATNATNAVNATNVTSGGTVTTNSIVAGTSTPFFGGVITAIDTTGGGNVFSANILNGAGTGFIATSATGASGFDYFGAWTQTGTKLAAIDSGGNVYSIGSITGDTVKTNSAVIGTTTPFDIGVVTGINTSGGGNVFSANIITGAGTGFIATAETGASGFDFFGAWTQTGTRLAAIDGGGNVDGQSFNYLEAGKISLTGVGYCYLFNGLLMQWGVGTYNNGDFVNFSIAMTNVWSLQITDNNGHNPAGSQSQQSNGFYMSLPAQTECRWLVLGSS